ncbi:MAG: hypothetical protein JXA42_00735 [Anaerolineales bacterium]|nr:hypothetical protein [Anaerolineales bacterium]
MKKEVGLWIDHREAFLVTITNSGEETTRFYSNMEKDGQFSTNSWSKGLQDAENMQDRKKTHGLDRYYDSIIKYIRAADSIQIFGPGEAKVELIKRLENRNPSQRSVRIETADKLTDPQIVAHVRQYFQGQV